MWLGASAASPIELVKSSPFNSEFTECQRAPCIDGSNILSPIDSFVHVATADSLELASTACGLKQTCTQATSSGKGLEQLL